MPASLFIEHRPTGLAFYINGHLQFDSADEAIYHEYLAIPAIALSVKRFPETGLRVLICGGGDGLAARDVLRFSAVTDLSLVDYSPEVLELGRTTFKPYNQGSLAAEQKTPLGSSPVTVYTEEAFAFVSQLPDTCFHAVICDFTSPTTANETAIYSREWFAHLRRILYPGGVVAVNGVSPEHTTTAFWSLYQTLLAAGLQPKPMRIEIPSFRQLDYGDWGFFLASDQAIARTDLEALTLPTGLRALESQTWLDVFRFPTAIAEQRHTVAVHTLASPQLLYYLLNPKPVEPSQHNLEIIDFLEISEIGNGLVLEQNALQLEAIAQRWLEHLAQLQTASETNPLIAIPPEELVPVQHYYHQSKMVTESLSYLRNLAQEIDLEKLFITVLERAQEFPPQIKQELQQLIHCLRSGETLNRLSLQTTELMTILFVVLMTASLAFPDAVFAKGYSSGVRSYGGSGSSGGSYYASEDRFGWLGFLMMLAGGVWLWNLNRNRED